MMDLIGDIHGHADKLEELLLRLGYAKHKGITRVFIRVLKGWSYLWEII